MSLILSGTICSEKQNHTEDRKTKGRVMIQKANREYQIKMLKSENPAYTCIL